MADDTLKPRSGITGGLQSEFNMGQYWFERYHEILKALDQYIYIIGNYGPDSMDKLRPCLSTLRVFYNNLQPLMDDAQILEMDAIFKEVEESVNTSWKFTTRKSMNIKGHKALINLHSGLLRLAQFKGIGLYASKKKDTKEKMGDLLGINRGKKSS